MSHPHSVTQSDPLLYSVEEVADMLNCGRATVFRLIRSGDLAIVNIGRRTLVRRDDIDALIEARTSTLTPSKTNTERDRIIRAAHAAGMSTSELARAYGVTRQRISQIVDELA